MERPIELGDIARGDQEVISRIYKDYQSDFRNWLRKMFHIDTEDSDELFQDSVVTLYENVINGKLIELRSSIKTYLFSIGKYKAMEFLRKSGRNSPLSGLEEGIHDDNDLRLESEAEASRKSRLLKACILELGETCRQIMKLYYFERLSLAEIKDRLNYKNEESLKSQKFKCMERLRSSFLNQYQNQL